MRSPSDFTMLGRRLCLLACMLQAVSAFTPPAPAQLVMPQRCACSLQYRGPGRARAHTLLGNFPRLPGQGGGPEADSLPARLKRDDQGDPRLCRVLAALLRGLLRVLLGARADVCVRGRSNRDVLCGRIAALSIDTGEFSGLLLSARGGSVRGTLLDLGLRPLLVTFYFPLLLLGVADFLSLTVPLPRICTPRDRVRTHLRVLTGRS